LLTSTCRSFCAALPLLVAAVPAAAQDSGAPADAPAAPDIAAGGDSITLGLGAAYIPDYEGSDEYRTAIAPGAIGSVSGFSFTLAGNRLSVDLVPDRPGPSWDVEAGPIAVVDFNRTSIKSIDDPRIRALGEVDTAIELGGYVGIGKTGVVTSPYDKLSVSVSYRHDVSGDHHSTIWQPSINYFTPLSRKAAVGLFASAEHAGDGYARTYYTVTPASGLPAYQADGGWKNYTVGALGTYALTGDLLHGLKLVAGGTYKRLLGDFAESPIVSIAGDRDQWMGAVGLAYTF
jgi:outer membrane protein